MKPTYYTGHNLLDSVADYVKPNVRALLEKEKGLSGLNNTIGILPHNHFQTDWVLLIAEGEKAPDHASEIFDLIQCAHFYLTTFHVEDFNYFRKNVEDVIKDMKSCGYYDGEHGEHFVDALYTYDLRITACLLSMIFPFLLDELTSGD